HWPEKQVGSSRSARDDLENRRVVVVNFRFLSRIDHLLCVFCKLRVMTGSNAKGTDREVAIRANVDARVVAQLWSKQCEHIAHACMQHRRFFIEPVQLTLCGTARTTQHLVSVV